MIITQLQGGTGNQLFQYALGYKIAKLRQTNLKLDISRYANAHVINTYDQGKKTLNKNNIKIINLRLFDTLREVKRWAKSPIDTKYYGTETIRTYRLDNFRITYCPLSTIDLLKLKLNNAQHTFNLVNEHTPYAYDKDVLNTPDNSYLVGFWHTFKYFEDIQDEIREQFTVVPPPSDENENMLKEISKTNSVCIHVRRGDYLVPAHYEHHGICSKEYYDNAIKLIKEKVKNPHFFIFSDEPDWARDNIMTNSPTMVSYNSLDKEYEDIRLMYTCKHFIIANSSFSAWGAWLSRDSQKIVIAPSKWVAKDINISDAIPETWIKL